MAKLNGRCLCGEVTWTYEGEIARSLVCHCTDCQRATSAPFAAFVGLRPEGLVWSGPITRFESSPQTWRNFCSVCGTRLTFRSDKWPGEVHVYAATLDPSHTYRPTAQVMLRSRADWLDDLPSIPHHNDFEISPTG
jgi:hypothetical protein